ncbi:MAG: exosortase C-terminal domain/associated protein EpsI [Acidobacteriaceae bacterium]
MRSPRFWSVVLLMALTALLLHVRGDVDRVMPSRPLSQLPMTIDSRSATDIAIDPDVLQVLGKGDFLNRVYAASLPQQGRTELIESGEGAPIGLFIGYFPTQRTGQSIHSPQNCLPGAGWSFESSWMTSLTNSAGKKYQVKEYLISDGISSQEVLYWYQMHGRIIAGDYAAKLFTLADSIRYGRTDAALIRIITPVEPGEERLHARARAVRFAEQLAPLLPAYVPD